MFIIDGMLSYGGVVPFLVKSNQTIGITYLGGIQIVEGRKMNVQVVFIGVECQGVFIGDRFSHDVCSGNKCRNVLAGLVKSGRRSYRTDSRDTSEINSSVVSLADSCRDKPPEQHGIVGSEVSGERMVFRVILYQFLVGVYPQMAVYVELQLVDNVSVQSAQPGVVGQFSCLWVQGVDSSLLCSYPDEAVFLHTQAGNGEGRRYFFAFPFGGLLIKPFIGGANP